ncbi:MAG TPA: hypothetical protein VMG55_06110 [Stellaceae bacterium]|nr:hypothetical protein [Stellaceae bacterium]
MAKSKRAAAGRRGKAAKARGAAKRGKPARKTAKRKAAKPAKKAAPAKKLAAPKKKAAAKKAAPPKKPMRPPIEVIEVETVEEPIPGVVVVTDYEAVRINPGVKPESEESSD